MRPRRHAAGLAKGANVLVITLDTVRTDRIGGYGYNQAMTPNIDAFLEESVGFEEALTVRALTEPSLASMLTGLYPYQHQVAGNGYQIVDPLPANLVDAFKRAGYEVNAIAANGCTLMRQFDWNDFRCTKTHDPRAVDAAIQVLDRSREQPQFLWLHLFATHSPYGGLGHAHAFPRLRRPSRRQQRRPAQTLPVRTGQRAGPGLPQRPLRRRHAVHRSPRGQGARPGREVVAGGGGGTGLRSRRGTRRS